IADTGILLPTRMYDGGHTLRRVACLELHRAAPAFQARHTSIDLPALLDGMRTLARDAALRQRLGAAAKARVEGYFLAAHALAPTGDAIKARVTEARANPGRAEPKQTLGADWQRVFGHYASHSIAVTKTGPGLWPLEQLPGQLAQTLGVSRRPMLQSLLKVAQ